MEPTISALIDTLTAAFPRVPATRGRAWTLAGQARLAESGVLPPPVPREEWRRAPLGADEGTVRRYPGIEAGAAHHVRPHTRGDGTIEPHRVRVRRGR